jgi:hypothetical protein
MVEKRGIDPFNVEVKEVLDKMREVFGELKLPEEWVLDAEAIREVATIIKLQGDWLKHLSTSLYVDSILIAFKVRTLSVKALAKSLLKSWTPIVSLDQISRDELDDAVEYWNRLLPLAERMKELRVQEVPTGLVDVESLLKSKLLTDKSFEEVLEDLWKELRAKAKDRGEVSYWEFVGADTYEDTVVKAYLTSFLLTYGYSGIRIDALTGKLFLVPKEEPTPLSKGEAVYSLPIPVSKEAWRLSRIGHRVRR